MKYLIDSDFLYALFKPDDSNHKKAEAIFKKVENDYLVILNLVVQECTTLVSKRIDMDNARKFYESLQMIQNEIIRINTEDEVQAWKIFLKQTKKGTSFIDCANLEVCEKYKLDGILSFDDFYPKKLILK